MPRHHPYEAQSARSGTFDLKVKVLPKKKLFFSVPVPPSENHCFITVNNRRILTKEGKQFVIESAMRARIAAKKFNWNMSKESKVVVLLTFFFPSKRKKDTHNTLKVLMDSFEGILYDDDYWALPRIMDFHIDRENPRLELVVYMK